MHLPRRVITYTVPDDGRLRRIRRSTGVIGTIALIASMLFLTVGTGVRASAVGSPSNPCGPPVTSIIACENTQPGDPPSNWQESGAGDPTIQGFATQMSVNVGQTVSFKIDTPASAYHVNILRIGWYQGDGARIVAANLIPTASLPQTQPSCLVNPDGQTGLIDCGNWKVSAQWTVPSNAVSGVYMAQLVRDDTGGYSLVPFVVRDDASHADIVYQMSDETMEAYNTYGGNSLYSCTVGCPPGNPAGYKAAFEVSYNRPFHSALDDSGRSWFFWAEFPMVEFLEQNGYDVSYTTASQVDSQGSLLDNHKIFISSAHDEYWSANQRTNVQAALAKGLNLAFFSGNEVFWKTRFADSADGSNTPYRTIVCYKETHFNAPTDPADPPTWTGTWADPRFSPPADGGQPQNALTGQLFMVNHDGSSLPSGNVAITVPSTFSKLRFWRNTAVASLGTGQSATLAPDSLGYEWDEDANNGFRPAGEFDMSSTTVSGVQAFLDYGTNVSNNNSTVTHHLSLYKAPSGALVFGAGTVQWAFGLEASNPVGDAVNPTMQQATVNLFADMGNVQPATLIPGLVAATPSSDTTPPKSTITSPSNNATVSDGASVTVSGTATDSGGGVVSGVEVSTDGGKTWNPANITTPYAATVSWTYTWIAHGSPSSTVETRAVDDSGNLEAPSDAIAVKVSCPCSIWGTNVTPTTPDSGDTHAGEVGVKFTTDTFGTITGVRFYKSVANTGTHIGNLWTSTGTLLASATFTNETTSGWQQVSFSKPVPVMPGTTYIASYFDPKGHYSDDINYFYPAPDPLPDTVGVLDSPPLHAVRNTGSNLNGVYSYSSTSSFPDTPEDQADNLWVDPVFVPAAAPGQPTNVAATPGYQAANVSWSAPTTGGPATSYTVTPYQGSTALPPTTVTGNPAPTNAVISGLTDGTSYTFRVTASNPNGSGPASAASNAVTPSIIPTFVQQIGGHGSNVASLSVTPIGNITSPDRIIVEAVVFGLSTSATAKSVTDSAGNSYTEVATTNAPDGTELSVWTAPVTYGGGTTPTVTVTATAKSDIAVTALEYAALSYATGAGAVDQVAVASGITGTASSNTVKTAATAATTNSDLAIGFYADSGYNNNVAPGSGFVTRSNVSPTSDAELMVEDQSVGKGATPAASAITGPSTPWAMATVGFLPGSAPAAPATPTGVTAAAGPGSATVTWTAPSNNGSPITSYTVTPYANGSAQAATTVYGSPPPTSTSVIGLTAGTSYTFRVSATNAVGTGPASSPSASITPGAPVNPGAPTNVQATPGESSATVSWTAPSNGGSTITSYAIAAYETDESNVLAGTTTISGSPPPATAAITGLTDGKSYQFTVTASNAVGTGSPSGYSNTVTPDPLPSAPGNPAATAGDGSATITWTAPVTGGAITSYTITPFIGSTAQPSQTITGSPPGTSATITGLTNGTAYTFTIRAANQVGSGPPSSPSAAVTPNAPGPPAAPTNVTGTAGNRSVSLTWSAPSSSGSPITTYTVTPYVGSVAQPSTVVAGSPPPTSAVVMGLANGTSYSFTVTAANTYGTGSSSAPSPPVTPVGPPPAPTGAVANAGSGAVTLAWTQGSDGGAPITSYIITPYIGSTAQTATTVSGVSGAAPPTSATVSGLTNGTQYTFTVTASNSYGIGSASGASNVATPLASLNCPCTVLGSSTPAQVDGGDPNPVNVGMQFTPDRSGFITGVRFYKASNNTGTHIGDLWSASGNLLASVTFASETTTGWQQANFASPVAVTAGSIYVVSYLAPTGHYSVTVNGLGSSGVVNPPLYALQNSGTTPNGLYSYASSVTFPVSSYSATNYWVDAVFNPTLPGPPAAPSGVTAVAGTSSAIVTWSSPSNGGSPILSYTVTPYAGSTALAATTVSGSPPATSATITGLTNGQSYTFRVAATNALGTGPASSLSNSIVAGQLPPSAPGTVTASAADGSAAVTWSAPTSDGGSPVTSYTVTPWIGSVAQSPTTVKGSPPATSATISGLTNGTTYTFTVTATNTNGTGVPSAGSNQTTPESGYACPCNVFGAATPAVPDAGDPTSVNVGMRFTTDVTGYITGLRFYKASTNTGTHVGTLWTSTGTLLARATFTNETASGWQQANFSTPVAVSAGTTYVVSYLAPNGHYSVTSGAFSAAGVIHPPLYALPDTAGAPDGLYSYGSSAAFPISTYDSTNYWVDPVFNTVIPAQAPSAPTGVTARATNGAVALSWGAPADGGSLISSYLVTPYAGSVAQLTTTVTGSPAPTSTSVSGLANGTTYTFTVIAVNATGPGPASGPSNPATPLASYSCPCDIFGSSAPVVADSGDATATNVGMKFTSDINGYISGIRFYKAVANTGTHVGQLWSTTGALLASVTFANETASGWQTASFGSPVAVTAGTTYLVSYYAPNGHYSATTGAFTTTGTASPPLYAVANPVSSNGVYVYASSPTFPSLSYSASNYWVDPVFTLTPPSSPSAPGAVNAIAGDALATVSWTAPPSDGSVITRYTVTPYIGSSAQTPTTVTGSPPATATTVSGLTNGSAYTFTVTATNAYGTGPASAPSNSIVVGALPPPAPTAVTAAAGNASATITWTAPSGSASPVTGYTITPYAGSTALAATTVMGNPPATTATVTGLTNGTGYTFTVSATSSNGTGPASGPSNVATPEAGYSCPCTIFGSSTPAVVDAGDGSGVELGLKFVADTSGYVTGLRFYKSAANSGTHIGNLWSSSGTLLATVRFVNETASGWQTADFSSPVAVTAGVTYVVSYYAPLGHYAATVGQMAGSAPATPPLYAVPDGTSPNGVYSYGSSSSFPASSYRASNYWVDPVFSPTLPGPPPAAPTAVTAAAGNNSATVAWTAPSSSSLVTAYAVTPFVGGVAQPATILSGSPPPTSATITGLANGTTYTFTVTATSANGYGPLSSASNPATPSSGYTCPCTIFGSSTPPVADAGDPNGVNVGLQFSADRNGHITGVRFYKAAANTGTHTGYLWTASGTLLTSAVFTTETSTGWQQVSFASPVAITAGTTYVVSYYAPAGHYSVTPGAFSSGYFAAPPLYALQNSPTVSNGVYAYGAGGTFPTSTYGASNYWVDPVFAP